MDLSEQRGRKKLDAAINILRLARIAASGPSKIWIHNSTVSQEGRTLIAWTEVAETGIGHDTIEIGVPISDPSQALTPGGREKWPGKPNQ